MKPEEYKIGTNIIYKEGSPLRYNSLYEGQILGYSDSKKYVNIKNKNSVSGWYELDSIHVVDTVKKIKSDVSGYMVDPAKNEFISKKKQSEEELQKVILKAGDKDDPRMTEEDWNDLANQLYSNKNTYECYPENYSETDCRYYLEIFNDTDWKLRLRNNMSIPKFGMSGELFPYCLGEGKIDKPEMISMYNLRNLKRIVDGLNLLVKPNENLNSYPKMKEMTEEDWLGLEKLSTSTPQPQATTDYFEKYKKENKD